MPIQRINIGHGTTRVEVKNLDKPDTLWQKLFNLIQKIIEKFTLTNKKREIQTLCKQFTEGNNKEKIEAFLKLKEMASLRYKNNFQHTMHPGLHQLELKIKGQDDEGITQSLTLKKQDFDFLSLGKQHIKDSDLYKFLTLSHLNLISENLDTEECTYDDLYETTQTFTKLWDKTDATWHMDIKDDKLTMSIYDIDTNGQKTEYFSKSVTVKTLTDMDLIHLFTPTEIITENSKTIKMINYSECPLLKGTVFGRINLCCGKKDLASFLDSDIICYGANAKLSTGGGTAGSIFDAVVNIDKQEEIAQQAAQKEFKRNYLESGEAIATKAAGGKLAEKDIMIIHGLAPDISRDRMADETKELTDQQKQELANVYRNTSNLAKNEGKHNLTIPLMGAGSFKVTPAESLESLADSIMDFHQKNPEYQLKYNISIYEEHQQKMAQETLCNKLLPPNWRTPSTESPDMTYTSAQL